MRNRNKTVAPKTTTQTEIFGIKVLFIPVEVIYGNINKKIDCLLSVITIANADLSELSVEDYKFEKNQNIFIEHELHETIFFGLKVADLKELIFESCKIYAEILKNNSAKAISKGWQYLYIEEINLYEENIISLKIGSKNNFTS